MSSPAARVASLTRRLEREKAARKQAETLLTEKSRALYDALTTSRSDQEKLELALWASQESYFEWHAEEDVFIIRSFGLRQKQLREVKQNAIALMRRVHTDDLPQVQLGWSMAVNGESDDIELICRIRGVGGFQWTRARGKVLERDRTGTATYIVGMAKDKTREHQAEQSFQLMASAFSSSREPMLVLSTSLQITESNEAFRRLARLGDTETAEKLRLDCFLRDAREPLERITQTRQERFETELTTCDGEKITVDVSLAVFEARHQTSSYLIATLRDISERKKNEQRLRVLANHDDLTGLKNRLGLRSALEKLVAEEQRFELSFIDLDGFKQINDIAGHELGDECLQVVTGLLKKTFPASAVVTRWGGDEFIIACPGLDKQTFHQFNNKAIALLEKQMFRSGKTELTLSASIGLASYPEDADSIDSIIQNADVAMYRAKTSGKGRVFEYHEGLAEHVKEQVSLLSDLRRTIRNRGLEFYLQGKYNVAGSLIGAELLCRWFSPLHGIVSPGVFIPLAEQYGLDMDIGLVALESACEYISMLETERISLPLSVNISANQLLSESFADNAAAICAEHFVSPELVEIEITESIFIQDETAAIKGLAALKAHGFIIALDDFGSGFSSLSYLRKFDFDVIKLDRSLVKGIDGSERARSLLNGIFKMLDSLRLEVIMEGIDNAAYLPLLEAIGINNYQGFLFEKPLPYDQFILKHTQGWRMVK
ncbi:MAG: EAL domain-containing protein [Alteromonadaceae bacterium TMED7]|nr:histidine kinase [Alteromonadaceae bacterium]MCP4864163.1 EAL domain-containing protein [Alteromonas sp.]RPH14771.1 MAG: EAL domain-containing protein [Alteromonadaceae bacterium TMED7]|tara:strand:- start:6406 stop:8553 length:2148 start_codon:yes stop_codon:yes gene_type:complete